MASLFVIKRILAVARSSCLEVFYEKGVLQNFAKFAGNTCVGVSFLIKLQPASLQLSIHVFSCEFCEIFKNIFFTEPLQTATSVLTRSILISSKNSLLYFFSPKLKLAFIELFWGALLYSHQSRQRLPLVFKHKFMFTN